MDERLAVLGTFLGFFAFDYVWFVFVYWLPGYLRLERHFTPGQIKREPERVLEAIRKALTSASGRPALDIRTVPAS